MQFDSQEFESYVPVYDVIPEQWDQARPMLVELLKKITNALNVREIGWYLDEEILTGKAFIPGIDNLINGSTSQVFRQVFRKVIDFGALPNAGTKSIPHGIVFDNNFTLTYLGAYATDPINFVAVPIPYVDPGTLANSIALTMDSTNINITTVINYSSFTRCFITVEYMQEI